MQIVGDSLSVWDFTDYRIFLKTFISAAKALGKPLSNRWFAKEIGVNSSSYMTLLLQGKRNLNKINAGKFSRLMELSRPESAYFEALVEFNQARKLEDRNRCYRALVLLRRRGDTQTLSVDQYEYYAQWHHSAVRALVHLMRTPENYAELAALVSPPITEPQAKRSMVLLEKLGLIKRGPLGKLEVGSPAISTGENIQSLQVANFQRETLRLGWEALDRFPKDERDMSTLTLTISQQGYKEICDLIKGFRHQVDAVVQRDLADDRVYQLNMQLYPLSKRVKKRSITHG